MTNPSSVPKDLNKKQMDIQLNLLNLQLDPQHPSNQNIPPQLPTNTSNLLHTQQISIPLIIQPMGMKQTTNQPSSNPNSSTLVPPP